MSLKDEIKYSLEFLNSNRKEITGHLPTCTVESSFESLHHTYRNALEEYYGYDKGIADNVADAFIAESLWGQLSESFFDLLVDGLSYSTFFREISIVIIRDKNVDTKDFCCHLIGIYMRTPQRFLFAHNKNYEIIWGKESEVQSILSMLYDTSFQYSEIDFTPLRLLVTLVPNDIKYMVDLCCSCRCPFLQYNLCYDFISDVMDVQPQTASHHIENFLLSFPLLESTQCNTNQRGIVEFFRASWQFVKHCNEPPGNSSLGQAYMDYWFNALKKRTDIDILIPTLGCFFINALDGDLTKPTTERTYNWKQTLFELLDRIKEFNISPSLPLMWNICREEAVMDINDVHSKFITEGNEKNDRTSCIAGFMFCMMFEKHDISLLKELLLLALESNDRLFASNTYNLNIKYTMWFQISEFICQSDELINFWIDLRRVRLVQKYYRERFFAFRTHKQYYGYSTKVYPIVSLLIIDKLIGNKRINIAETLWETIWLDFINKTYLCIGHELEFLKFVLFYLICLKMELIQAGGENDLQKKLDDIPLIMDLPNIARGYLESIK